MAGPERVPRRSDLEPRFDGRSRRAGCHPRWAARNVTVPVGLVSWPRVLHYGRRSRVRHALARRPRRRLGRARKICQWRREAAVERSRSKNRRLSAERHAPTILRGGLALAEGRRARAWSAPRRTEGSLSGCRNADDKTERGRPDRYAPLDVRFHTGLVEVTGRGGARVCLKRKWASLYATRGRPPAGASI